jgi:hypothetical protein
MLTGNDRKNIVIASVIILALIVACAATIGLYKSAVAEHVDRDTINITRDSYAQALAKWQGQHLKQYQMTVSSDGGEVAMIVAGDGGVQVLRQSYEGQNVAISDAPGNLGQLRQMTVEHMFQLALDALDKVQKGQSPTQSGDGKSDYFYDYDVHLDAALGYPTYFAEYRRVTRPSREITWREVVQPVIVVKDFTSTR